MFKRWINYLFLILLVASSDVARSAGPIIWGPSGVAQAINSGAIKLKDGETVITDTGAATVTSKTVDSSTFYANGITWQASASTPSKQMIFDFSGIAASTQGILAFTFASDGNILTMPGSTDTVVARATTDTLSNKTFSDTPLFKSSLNLEDPGAGTNKITLKAPTLSGDYNFTLPVNGGTNTYVLTTNGSGTTSWTATGFSGLVDTSNGLMAANLSDLSDAAATRMGMKQYLHGTTYNGGIAPTVTLSSGGGSISAVTRALFIPKQLQDGTWHLWMSAEIELTSTARTAIVFAINGITSKNVANWTQIVTGNYGSVSGLAYAMANTNTVEIDIVVTSSTHSYFAGDIELDSKPTWAY